MNKEKIIDTLKNFHEKPLLILITGSSGSGKTTIGKALESCFPQELISIYYFDDIGIPCLEDMIKTYGSGEKWQQQATETWIEKLSRIKDKKIIVLEGSFNPEFAFSKAKEFKINFLLICLHANRESREKRLIEKRYQPELANQDMENFAQFLRKKPLKQGEM